ncbi:C4-dicarboxylate ABC transporter [Hydrogenophaga sp.]|uniref:SLAC1 family transporter n=1 Tax=Hydrogenophaga sp. TaxID=1904254 RepID=UPI00260EF015|nr:C4-dicarboxylate ABC transporter [Hydrogenophaga sp.]MCW5654846.1 C4-dicarboxylate ABC transporter [Hydrogenophaga sp.]
MRHATPLKFLMPGWFSLVMGLCGLALAWHRAQGLLGDMAEGVALVLGVAALLVFLVLLVASAVRGVRYAQALAEDLRHPVRHAFVAALPVSLLLLATVGVALAGPQAPLAALWQTLWWLGSLGQLWATLWVLGRWLAPPEPGAPPGLWPAITPVLLIPVVGNVVVPLAGLPLGHGLWSAAQFGIGAVLWPVVLALLLARRIAHGPLPERILPAWFITVAPPAVIGVALLQWQAPLPLALGAWGVAVFFLLWVATLAPRLAGQPFTIAFWALSFPLAALTVLTLRLADATAEPALRTLGLLLLAMASLAVLWLGFATVRGLREGSLLAPEPVAAIAPAAA